MTPPMTPADRLAALVEQYARFAGDGDTMLARVPGGSDADRLAEKLANAELISAAPDLVTRQSAEIARLTAQVVALSVVPQPPRPVDMNNSQTPLAALLESHSLVELVDRFERHDRTLSVDGRWVPLDVAAEWVAELELRRKHAQSAEAIARLKGETT